MSDLHPLPLRGRDLPEHIPGAERHKARVYDTPDGWLWEHECSPGYWKDSGDSYPSREAAYGGAVKHLEVCCRD